MGCVTIPQHSRSILKYLSAQNITTKYLLAVIFQSALFVFEVFLQLCVFFSDLGLEAAKSHDVKSNPL